MNPYDVQTLRNCAVLNAASARALIRAIGMHAENMHRQSCGNSIAYGENAFLKVIEEEGIYHNAVMETLSPY